MVFYDSINVVFIYSFYEEVMFGKKKFDMNKKQQVKMIIAIVCVLSFAVVFLVSAIHFSSHTTHAGSAKISTGPCQRTLVPVCRCASVITPASVKLSTHVHNESHVDCYICVIVQKTIEQTRLLSVAEILVSDLNLFILTGIILMFILVNVPTPVTLKTRTNN